MEIRKKNEIKITHTRTPRTKKYIYQECIYEIHYREVLTFSQSHFH